MEKNPKDAGVIAAVVERLNKLRLPRALALKEKVDAGGKLDEFDIEFLEEVFADASTLKPLVDRHPEYEELAAKMVGLYHDITSKALENEKSS